ncbi:MAG: sugar ABC transporter permease, partial [Christensenellaceae bacterium]|nr:sugar ABC transporter permease [Christensenellaceae bacterium]
MSMDQRTLRSVLSKSNRGDSLPRLLWKQRQLIILSLPVIFVFFFSYFPLWGWIIAFQDYKVAFKGNLFQQQWVGLQNFVSLFTDATFLRSLRNSLGIGLLTIAFSYFFTLLLAVLLNEIKVSWFKRTVQTISYLP